MPRSNMPALAVLASGCRKTSKIVFDADGLAADKSVDLRGLSPESLTYRMLRGLCGADRPDFRLCAAFRPQPEKPSPLSQLEWGRHVSAGATSSCPMVATPDLTNSSPKPDRLFSRARSDIPPDALVACYVGSLGEQYEPQLMLRAAQAIKARFPESALRRADGQPGANGSRDRTRRNFRPGMVSD